MGVSDESFDILVARKVEALGKAANAKTDVFNSAVRNRIVAIDPNRDYQGIQNKLNATGSTDLSFAHNSMFAKDQDADSARGMNPQGEQTAIRALGIDTWEHDFYGRNRTLRPNQVKHYARLFGIDPSEVTAEQIFAMGRRADNKFRNLLTEGQRGQFDPESETYSAIPGKQFEGFEESLWFPEGFRENASYGANVTYDPLSRKYKTDKRTKVDSFINPNTGVDLYKAMNTPEFNTRWFDNTVEQNAIRSAYEAEHGTAYNTFKAPTTGDHQVLGYNQYGKPRIVLDGEVVSEKSITLEMDGKWINVPTIWNGEKQTEEWVKEKLINNEIPPTSVHDSQEEAETAANRRSLGMEEIPLGEDKFAKKYKNKYAFTREEKEHLFGKDSYWDIFSKSVSASTDNLQATGYGVAAYIADATGNEDFATAMLEEYQRNLAEARNRGADLPKVEDVNWLDPDQFFRQFLGAFGEFLPSIVGGVGTGAIVAHGVKAFIRRKAKSWAMSSAKKALAANAAAGTAGTVATTALYSGVGTGSVYGDIGSAGYRDNEARAVALGAGVLIGLLDTVLPKQIAKQLGLSKKAREYVVGKLIKKGFVNSAGKVFTQTLKGAATEGVTETLQEVIEDIATTLVKTDEMPEFTSDEAMSKWLNVFVKSALGGGGIKGLTTVGTEGYKQIAGDTKVVRDAVSSTLSEAIKASENTFNVSEKDIIQSEKNLASAVLSVENQLSDSSKLGVSQESFQQLITETSGFSNLDKAEAYLDFFSTRIDTGGSDDGEANEATKTLRTALDAFTTNESELEHRTDVSPRLMDLDKEIQAINTKFDAKPNTAKNKAERKKQIAKRIQVTQNKLERTAFGPAKKQRKAKRAETKVIREAIEKHIKKIHQIGRKLKAGDLSKKEKKLLERERNNIGRYISKLSESVNLSATTAGKLKRAIAGFDYKHVGIKEALKEDNTILNHKTLKETDSVLAQLAKDKNKDIENVDRGINILNQVEDSIEALIELSKKVTEQKDRLRISKSLKEHKELLTKYISLRKTLIKAKAESEQNEAISTNETFKAKTGNKKITTIKLVALANSDRRNNTSAAETKEVEEILRETYGDEAAEVYVNALQDATQHKTKQKLETKKTQDVSEIADKAERKDKLHSLDILYSLDPHTEEELNEIDVESLNAEELVVLNIQKKIAKLRDSYAVAVHANSELVAVSEEIEGGEGTFFKGLTKYIEQAKNGKLDVEKFTDFVDHIIRKDLLFSNALEQSTEDVVVNISKSPLQIVESVEGKEYPSADYWWIKKGATENLVAFIKTEAELATATTELINKISEYEQIETNKEVPIYKKVDLIDIIPAYAHKLNDKLRKLLKDNHILNKLTGYVKLLDTAYLTPDLLRPIDNKRVSFYSINKTANLDDNRIRKLTKELGITDEVFIDYLVEYFNEFKDGFNKELLTSDNKLRITANGAYISDKAINLLYVKDEKGNTYLPDEVIFSMMVATIKWTSLNIGNMKYKRPRDIGMLLRNDPKYKPRKVEYKVFGNMGIVLANAINDIGGEVVNSLNLKSAVESVESTEMEKLLTQLSATYSDNSPLLKDPAILNALKGSVGLMAIKIAASIKTENALKVKDTDIDAGLLTIRHGAYNSKYWTVKSDKLPIREINTVLLRDLEDEGNSDIQLLLESFKHNTDAIKRINGSQSTSLADILSEPAEAPEFTYQSFFLLPPKVRAVLTKLNNVEWTHKEAMTYFKLLSPKSRAALVGIVDPKDKHISQEESHEAANAEKLHDLNLVDDYNENGTEKFYYQWVAQKQHRLLIRSVTINGQRSKIHRALYKIFGNDSVISTKQQRLVFKIAVAQALGFKTDGNTLDATLDFFDNFAHEASTDIVDYIQVSILKGTQDKRKFNKLLNEFLKKTKENTKGKDYSITPSMHVLEAITALAQYKEKGKFTSDIMLETDAITNGYAISLMQRLGTNPDRVAEYVEQLEAEEYDLTSKEIKNYAEAYALSDSLARIGMFVNTQNEHPSGVVKPGEPAPTNYEEFLLSGAYDTYQTLGSRVAAQIEDDPKALGKKATSAYGKKAVTLSAEHVKGLEVLVGIFTDSEDRLTKFARDFAKNPVLISGYGAGVARVVEAISQDGSIAIRSKLAEFQLEYDALNKNSKKNAKAITKLKAKVRTFERSLNIFFSSKFLEGKGKFDLIKKLNDKDNLRTLDFSDKQLVTLEEKLFAIYKHPVETALDEILKPMAEMREVITNASEYQALSFIIQYKKEIAELVKPNVEDRLQVAEKLAPELMPLYYGPWTSPETPIQLIKIVSEIDFDEKVEIAFKGKKINRYHKKGKKFTLRKINKGSTATLSSPGRGRAYDTPGPSAYTNMVQNMDFVNLATTLMKKGGALVLPIHDAEMSSVNDAVTNVKNFNSGFLTNSLENSFLQLTLEQLLNVKKNMDNYPGLATKVAKEYKYNSYKGKQLLNSLSKKNLKNKDKKVLKEEQASLTFENIEQRLKSEIKAVKTTLANLENIYGKRGKHSWIGQSSTMYLPESLDADVTIEAEQTESAEASVKNQPESTSGPVHFDEELAEKIENILTKLYPEIELSFTDNPIAISKEPNTFNQVQGVYARHLFVIALFKRLKKQSRFNKSTVDAAIVHLNESLNPDLERVPLKEKELEELALRSEYKTQIPKLRIFDALDKMGNNNISLKADKPLNLVGKKGELRILNEVRDIIIKNNPELRTISPSDFKNEVTIHLETNYLLGFAKQDDSSFNIGNNAYKVKDSFSFHSEKDADRRVRHQKWSIRYNDTYLNPGRVGWGGEGHFALGPVAFGSLTYFPTSKEGTIKDAGLIHEMQADFYEQMRALANNESSTKERIAEIIPKSMLETIAHIKKYPEFFSQLNYQVEDKEFVTTFKAGVEHSLALNGTYDGAKISAIARKNKALETKKAIKTLYADGTLQKFLEEANAKFNIKYVDGKITVNVSKTVAIGDSTYNAVNTEVAERFKIQQRDNFVINKITEAVADKETAFFHTGVVGFHGIKGTKQEALLLKKTLYDQQDVVIKIRKGEIQKELIKEWNIKNISKYKDLTDLEIVAVKDKISYLVKLLTKQTTAKDGFEKTLDFVEKLNFSKDDIEFTHFNVLAHKLLQEHIAQAGKNTPVYFAGSEITKVTQAINPDKDASLLYMGKEEALIENESSSLVVARKAGPLFAAMSKIKGIKLEYVESIPGIKGSPGGYKINLDKYDQKDITLFNQKDAVDRILGQADIDALTVLIDAKHQRQDTLPHEYAHHYIHMFRDSEIVQEGIKRFGTEEKLVQAIGEQVVIQEGEALNWWNKFVTWILSKLSDKEVLQILTDSFLVRKDIYRDFGVAEATIKPNPDDILQSINEKVKQKLTPIMENESLQDNLKGIFKLLAKAKGSPNFDGKGEAAFNTHLKRVFDELIVGATEKLGDTTVTLNETDVRANGNFDPNIDAVTVNQNQFTPLTYAEQGAQEVYLHEIIHKLTRHILASNPEFRNKVNKIRTRIRAAIKQNAKKNGTKEYEIFLHKDADGKVIFLTDKDSEIEIAKEKYEYVFGVNVPAKNVLDEFLAYSLTNQFLFNELSTMPSSDLRLWSTKDTDTVVEKIIKLFANIIEMISNKINKKEKSPNLALELYELTKDIVNINESKRGKITQLLYDTELGKKLDAGNEMVVSFFKELKDKSIDVGSKKYFEMVDKWTENGKVNSFISNLLYSSKVLLLYASYHKFIDDHPKLRRFLDNRFKYFPSRFRDHVASVAVDFFGNTDNSFSKLQYKSQKEVDVNRTADKELVIKQLLNAFISETELSDFEQVALTKAVIKPDASILIENDLYSFDAVINLYKDEKHLKKEIKKYFHKLSLYQNTHYAVQADQLAEFMVKGQQGNHLQYKNAHAIHNLAKKRLKRTGVAKDLDIYTSLLAIQKTEKTIKDTFVRVAEREFKASRILKKDPAGNDHNGITHMFHFHIAIKSEVLKDGFNNNPMLVTKGFVADITPDDIQIEFNTIDAITVAEMRAKEYILSKVLGKVPGVKNVNIGLYVSVNNPRLKRVKGIGSLTSMQHAGRGLKDILASNPETAKGIIEQLEKFTENQRKQINKVDTKNATMMPILDDWGNISDFSIHMSHALKEDLLKQNLKFSEVMASTLSRHKDKVASKSIDKEAVQLLHEYKLENYSKHPNRFVNILSPAYIKEYFVPLPGSMKYEIMQRATKGKKDAFYVERKYLDIVFGYVLPSISNLPLFSFHPRLQRYARIGEKAWMELVAVAKTNIILKIPAVPALNFMSNFFTSWVAGVPPNYIIKKWKEGALELKRYNEDLENYKSYEFKLLGNPSLVGPNTIKKKAILLAKLNENPVSKFIDMGLFNSITEDIYKDDYTYRHKVGGKIADSKFGKGMQKYTKGKLFEIANQAYIGESTATFKAITHFTQMSDFIARYTMYRYKTEVKGMDKEKVWKEIVDTFVSYDQPLNRYIQWGNDIGALFFIKYAIRIQRATWHQLTNQPLNVGMLLATTQLAGLDIETIFESSFLLGNFDPNIAGFGKTIEEVAMFPGLEILGGEGF